jgi:phosphatidylglycerol:prolipoprotein diacylglycerol transferase
MYPVLFEFSNPVTGEFIRIGSYGVMMLSGYIVAVVYVLIAGPRSGLDSLTGWLVVTEIFAAGLLGAFIWDHFWSFLTKDTMSHTAAGIDFSGLAWQGGVIFAAIFGIWFIKFSRLRVLPTLDLLAPLVFVGMIIGRVGCLLGGCCYGKPTSLPWGIAYPINDAYSSAPANMPLHPTPLYSILGAVIGLLLFIWAKKIFVKDGQLFVIAVGLNSLSRFVIEFFRGDHDPIVWFLTFQQIVALLVIAAAYYTLTSRGRFSLLYFQRLDGSI